METQAITMQWPVPDDNYQAQIKMHNSTQHSVDISVKQTMASLNNWSYAPNITLVWRGLCSSTHHTNHQASWCNYNTMVKIWQAQVHSLVLHHKPAQSTLTLPTWSQHSSWQDVLPDATGDWRPLLSWSQSKQPHAQPETSSLTRQYPQVY